MRKLSVGIICLLVLAGSALAEITLSGYVNLDERLQTTDPGGYSFNRSYLGIKLKSTVSEQAAAYGELRIKSMDYPQVYQGNDLTQPGSVSPVQLELREAYVDLYSFPAKSMDLRAGKQRIVWGTADKLNQVDNINPYDFTDPLDFGEKIPTTSLKLTSYFDDNTFTAVVVPVFTPAILPSIFNDILSNNISRSLPPGITLATVETSAVLPAPKSENTMYGLKLDRNILGYDMSLSYFTGFDSIPNMAQVTLTPVTFTSLKATVIENFPKIQVLGYDLAGSFRGIGLWGEIAMVTPDNCTQQIVAPGVTTMTQTGNYTKYVFGGDYSFNNGVYINSQFMHGFFDDRGASLTDIMLSRIEKKVCDEKVKLAFNWGAELDERIVGNIFGPEVTWYPADATEVNLGAYSIDGDPGTKLSYWKELDQAYFKVKYSF